MKTAILGKGWVTNHGCGEDAVLDAIEQGKSPHVSEMVNPFTNRVHHVALIAKEDYAEAESFRRARRSSTITLLALTAAKRAIQNSGIAWSTDVARRTAVIFVSSDGGVIYTRRFYSEIVKSGASGASPLLFPETVYNAPASHLCAYFEIEGDAITLVGDTAVGSNALHHASEILAMGQADYCMVVGAEEMDWILCEAYSVWKQTRDSRERFKKSTHTGAIFAEGAAAILLGRSASSPACKTHPGSVFQNQREAGRQLQDIYGSLASGVKINAIVSSANGTPMDAIESAALTQCFPGVPVHRIKETLGEALAAGALQQTIFATVLAQNQSLKPDEGILVSTLGFNGLAGAVLLTPPETPV
ncbi:MAG: beta-ketoacyl synthase N-terminal-like domain-containing protein [Chthoniobacterales bacterium]